MSALTLSMGTLDFFEQNPEVEKTRRPLKERMVEFQREAWRMAGIITQFRELDGHLLAQIRVSEKMKALTADKSGTEKNSIPEEAQVRQVREGVILALKACGEIDP